MRAICVIVTALLCCGCFPARFVVSPAVRGAVVDRATGAPVAGAEVIISGATFNPSFPMDPVTRRPLYPNETNSKAPKAPALSEVLARARKPAVQTADDGSFSIPEQARWGPYYVGMDPMPPQGTILIRRSGYSDFMLPVLGINSYKLDLGTVPLDSVPLR